MIRINRINGSTHIGSLEQSRITTPVFTSPPLRAIDSSHWPDDDTNVKIRSKRKIYEGLIAKVEVKEEDLEDVVVKVKEEAMMEVKEEVEDQVIEEILANVKEEALDFKIREEVKAEATAEVMVGVIEEELKVTEKDIVEGPEVPHSLTERSSEVSLEQEAMMEGSEWSFGTEEMTEEFDEIFSLEGKWKVQAV
ncbi:hypothetical protein BGX27_007871 [Mortierella sp. AM989]|nr:hypothetical protein BGX27_007871 [Mortierella sp. AM989]